MPTRLLNAGSFLPGMSAWISFSSSMLLICGASCARTSTTTTPLALTKASTNSPPSPTQYHQVEPFSAEISWAASSTITFAILLALLYPLLEFYPVLFSPHKNHLFRSSRVPPANPRLLFQLNPHISLFSSLNIGGYNRIKDLRPCFLRVGTVFPDRWFAFAHLQGLFQLTPFIRNICLPFLMSFSTKISCY